MPQLELKRTGEGDGEEGIVDNSLRADVRRGEGREEEEGGRLGCDGKGAAYRVIDVKVDTKVSIGMSVLILLVVLIYERALHLATRHKPPHR